MDLIYRNSKKVLVVDDEPCIRDLLKEILFELGIDAHEACNGSEALAKYKRLKYDLLLVDIKMPKTSGIELVKSIREHDDKTKIIMVTSCAEKSVIKELAPLKIQGWFLKPFDLDLFKEKVGKALNLNALPTESL